MGKAAVGVALTDSERGELASLAARRKTAQGLAQRARIVLLAAEGLENKRICERVGASPNTVGKWRRRFAERRLEGLLDDSTVLARDSGATNEHHTVTLIPLRHPTVTRARPTVAEQLVERVNVRQGVGGLDEVSIVSCARTAQPRGVGSL